MNSASWSRLENAARRFGSVSLLLLPAALIIYLLPELTTWLQFDRQTIAAGQWWRIASCHWTHWSWDHLFWDALAFGLLGIMCEAKSRRRFLECLLGSVLLIPLAVWIFLPDMQTYRGLSGLDSALFVLLALEVLVESYSASQWRWVAVASACLLAFVAKISFELASDMAVFVDCSNGMIPVPLAHIAGAFVGAAVILRERGRALLCAARQKRAVSSHWAMPAQQGKGPQS